jgi:uncharacterized protein (TIGR00369 family)
MEHDPGRSVQSRAWKALHAALSGGELPAPRRVGVKMTVSHRACTPGKWSGEAAFERGGANSLGIIHGGFLASLLDIAMGYASVTLLGAREQQRTLEMKINFLRAVPPGRMLLEGECLRRGKRTAYCEGSVRTTGGDLVARGSATFSIGAID